MAVPDNNTFPLSVVVAEIGASQPRLSTCFAEAVSGGFNPAYEGNKDRLSNFRAYDNNPIVGFVWNFITNQAINNTRWSTGNQASFDPDGALNIAVSGGTQNPILSYIGQVGFPLPTGFPDPLSIYKLEFTIRGGGTATGQLTIRAGVFRQENYAEAVYNNGALTNSVPMAFNEYMQLNGSSFPFVINAESFQGNLIIEEIRIVGVSSGFTLDVVFNIPGNLQGWTLGGSVIQNAQGAIEMQSAGAVRSIIGITTPVPVVGDGSYSWSILWSTYAFAGGLALYRRRGESAGENQDNYRMLLENYNSGQRMFSYKNRRTTPKVESQGLIHQKAQSSTDTGTIVRTQIFSGL